MMVSAIGNEWVEIEWVNLEHIVNSKMGREVNEENTTGLQKCIVRGFGQEKQTIQ